MFPPYRVSFNLPESVTRTWSHTENAAKRELDKQNKHNDDNSAEKEINQDLGEHQTTILA